MIFVKSVRLWWLVVGVCVFADGQNVTENEIRPYEFTFNIVDFQHRSEKKDDDGLITGEYGFITADGIYHETAYATDATGDFIITKMRHRKITSLKDAEEIFKDNPERAKMLAEALVKSCAGCELAELDRQETSSFAKAAAETIATTADPPRKSEARLEKKLDLAMKEMMKVLNKKSESNADNNAGSARLSHKEKKLSRSGKELLSPSISDGTIGGGEIIRDMVDAAKKLLETGDGPENEREPMSEEALERMANDLFYRFNYTITSHSHWEDGFRDGRKDGEFNAKFREGVDTHVKYVSNEFGYQPNITLVPRQEEEEEGDNGTGEEARVNDDEATTTTTATMTTTTSPGTTYGGHYFNWFKK